MQIESWGAVSLGVAVLIVLVVFVQILLAYRSQVEDLRLRNNQMRNDITRSNKETSLAQLEVKFEKKARIDAEDSLMRVEDINRVLIDSHRVVTAHEEDRLNKNAKRNLARTKESN